MRVDIAEQICTVIFLGCYCLSNLGFETIDLVLQYLSELVLGHLIGFFNERALRLMMSDVAV